jgi:hypothetical protein
VFGDYDEVRFPPVGLEEVVKSSSFSRLVVFFFSFIPNMGR